MYPVILNIPDTAQNDGLGKKLRAVGIAGPKLSQQGYQCIPDQCIHFIQKQYCRFIGNITLCGQKSFKRYQP